MGVIHIYILSDLFNVLMHIVPWIESGRSMVVGEIITSRYRALPYDWPHLIYFYLVGTRVALGDVSA